MRGVDEACEGGRAAVGAVRRVRVHAVVPPAAVPGEGRDGHQLDRGDAEPPQAVELRDDAVERARVAERPDVELVEDEIAQGQLRPLGDLEGRGVDDAGRACKALGLVARAGIREPAPPVQDEHVVVAGLDRREPAVQAVVLGLERVFDASEEHADVLGLGRPDPELHLAGERHRAEAALVCADRHPAPRYPPVPVSSTGR